jgi:predicted lactoylglutathione lyase
MHMETNKIELTPEQKGVLASLSQETGEPVDALIDQVLKELQGRVQTPKKGFKEVLRSWSLEDLDLERVNGQDRDDIEFD